MKVSKKAAADNSNEESTKPAAKKTSTKKKVSKKASSKKSAGVDISLKHLAKELDMDPKEMRAALREAGIKPQGFRYSWSKGDKQLIKVKQVLKKALG